MVKSISHTFRRVTQTLLLAVMLAGGTPALLAQSTGGPQAGDENPLAPRQPSGYSVPSGFSPPAGPSAPQRPPNWPGGNNQLPPSAGGPVQGATTSANPSASVSSPLAGFQQITPAVQNPYAQAMSPQAPPSQQSSVTAQQPAGQKPQFVARANSGPNAATKDGKAAGPPLVTAPLPPQAFEAGRIATRVGDEIILSGDVMSKVNDEIAAKKVPKEYVAMYREQRFPQALYQMIQDKLILTDARRTIPKESFPKIEQQMNEQFDKNMLPKLLKDEDCTTQKELDDKLRQRGSSLAFQKRNYFDHNMAQQWGQAQLGHKKEIPYSEISDYYKAHLADYQFAAQARWEEMMVESSKFPSKAAAFAAVAAMGNDVLRGVAFADVAKKGSQGSTAADGGMHDWTTRGSLASDAIDQAIFSLPVGRMSQIIEDDRGFHIIRVVERKDAGQTPFGDVQKEIRKTIEEENYKKSVKEFMQKMKDKTPVWTMYDDQGGLNKVLGIKDE